MEDKPTIANQEGPKHAQTITKPRSSKYTFKDGVEQFERAVPYERSREGPRYASRLPVPKAPEPAEWIMP